MLNVGCLILVLYTLLPFKCSTFFFTPSCSPPPFQLMKFTQKKCNNKLPITKSANARSCEMLPNSFSFSGFVCMRSEAVSTNWPTVALKPLRKALNGCSNDNQQLQPNVVSYSLPKKFHSLDGVVEGRDMVYTYKVSNQHYIKELQRAYCN
jgi:hypothetical protein